MIRSVTDSFFCWLTNWWIEWLVQTENKHHTVSATDVAWPARVLMARPAFRNLPKISLILPTFKPINNRLLIDACCEVYTYGCVCRCPSPRPQRSTCTSAGGKGRKKKKEIKVRMNLNKIASLAFMCPTRGIKSSLISNTVSWNEQSDCRLSVSLNLSTTPWADKITLCGNQVSKSCLKSEHGWCDMKTVTHLHSSILISCDLSMMMLQKLNVNIPLVQM